MKHQLRHAINHRFGFQYVFPGGWSASISTNNDGLTLTLPSNRDVEIREYAHFAVTETSLTEWAARTLNVEGRRHGFQVISYEMITSSVRYESIGEKSIPAILAKYRVRENDVTLVIQWLFTQLGDVQFAVRCQTPEELLSMYQSLFDSVVQGFQVLAGSGQTPTR